jgi:hypothetical protein
MKRRRRIGLPDRWSLVSSMVVLSGLWSLPHAQASVPLGQKGEVADDGQVTPSMRPSPPTTAAGPGQRVDSDGPPAPRRRLSTPDDPATNTHIGVGYKIGNGLGFFGLDTIVSPVPHIAFDIQVSLFSVPASGGTAAGVGWAPMFQLYFSDPGRSTAYLGVGWIHAEASLQNVKASVDGFAANLGYEWKWQSGFGILLGAGVANLGNVTATDGTDTVNIDGGVHFNLEFGLRYMLM